MSENTEITGSIVTQDGLQLFYRKYATENSKAGILLSHGLSEHTGRYAHFVEHFQKQGFSLWMADHRGHGRSQGPRGHVLHFDQYIMDLRQMAELAREELGPDKKLFLVGHSMGGLIAANFAIKFGNLIDGVVTSSPALGMTVKVPIWKETLGKVMSNIYPSLSMENDLPLDKVSHDPEVVRDRSNDPLTHSKVSARWFTEFVAAMEETQNGASQIDIPVLMQIAGDDYFVNAKSSREFFDKLTTDPKEFHLYDGLYHEIYHESADDRAKVMADLDVWFKERLA
jgi:alpha-beta hydrolase superfamily lysophospholipase